MKVFRVVKSNGNGFLIGSLVQEVIEPRRSEVMTNIGAYWVRGECIETGRVIKPIIQMVFTRGSAADVKELETEGAH